MNSIRRVWLTFSRFLQYDVGDDNRVKFWQEFWQDVWCGDCPLNEDFLELYSIRWSKESFVLGSYFM